MGLIYIYAVLFLCDPQLYIHMKVEHSFVDMKLACTILVVTTMFQVDVAVLADTIELAKLFLIQSPNSSIR